jgi:hypothetical protein
VWALRNRRAEQTTESILRSADMSPDDLARAVRDNEALGDIFAQAVEIGSRARNDEKRRALGYIVARAFLHPDTARVDETEVLLSTLDELDSPHVQALVLLHQAHEQTVPPDARHNPSWVLGYHSLATKDIVERAPGMGEVARPVMSTLARLGLAQEVIPLGGPAGGGSSTVDRWTITEFGELMLRWLTLEEGERLRIDD